MKLSIYTVIASIFISSAAQAVQPTMFTCQDVNNPDYVVGYTTTSFTGQPTFTIQNEFENVVPGNQEHNLVSIIQEQTAIGQLATAVVNRKFLADAPALTYSLVVPGIEMGFGRNVAEQVEFETVLLIGTSGGFMPLPAVYQRVNEIRNLHCTAEYAVF